MNLYLFSIVVAIQVIVSNAAYMPISNCPSSGFSGGVTGKSFSDMTGEWYIYGANSASKTPDLRCGVCKIQADGTMQCVTLERRLSGSQWVYNNLYITYDSVTLDPTGKLEMKISSTIHLDAMITKLDASSMVLCMCDVIFDSSIPAYRGNKICIGLVKHLPVPTGDLSPLNEVQSTSCNKVEFDFTRTLGETRGPASNTIIETIPEDDGSVRGGKDECECDIEEILGKVTTDLEALKTMIAQLKQTVQEKETLLQESDEKLVSLDNKLFEIKDMMGIEDETRSDSELDFERKIDGLRARLDPIAAKCKPMFAADLTSNVNSQGKVVFDRSGYNDGSYDGSTGEFKAPRDGSYLIMVYVLAGKDSDVDVFVNEDAMAKAENLFSVLPNDDGTMGFSVVLELGELDVVTVRLKSDGTLKGSSGATVSSFSAILLNPF